MPEAEYEITIKIKGKDFQSAGVCDTEDIDVYLDDAKRSLKRLIEAAQL